MKNVVIAHFYLYNQRRYSSPWVCVMTDDGQYDFSERVGAYTGEHSKGEEGDLVVFEPRTGVVYGYGQKDYRGANTVKEYAKWDGEQFVRCDKLGRQIDTKGAKR